MRPAREFSKSDLIRTTERLLVERHALRAQLQVLKVRRWAAAAAAAGVAFVAGLAAGWWVWA